MTIEECDNYILNNLFGETVDPRDVQSLLIINDNEKISMIEQIKEARGE